MNARQVLMPILGSILEARKHIITLNIIVLNEERGIMKKDVICGMKVREDTEFVSEFQGREFYFCSSKCKVEFDKNPLKHSR